MKLLLDTHTYLWAINDASMQSNTARRVRSALWTGKSAFTTWGADFDKDAKAKGLTDPMVSMEAPLVNDVTRDVAYFVCPMIYTYKLKGVPMREPARMVMVLHEEGAAWRYVSWTWTGTVHKVAK